MESNKVLCLEFGTIEQDNLSGLCINGHDNWLEEKDDISRFLEASIKFNKSLSELVTYFKG